MRNSLTSGVTQYTVQNLYFKNAFIGSNRDPLNLLVRRKIFDGNIVLKNDDFDATEDFFFVKQYAKLYIDEASGLISQNCIVSFLEPNYTTKTIEAEIEIIDEYSEFYNGVVWGTTLFKEATSEKSYKTSDLYTTIETYFADVSQYQYDNEASGSELWGIEYVSLTDNKDVYYLDALKFDSGGESQGNGEINIDKLLSQTTYISQLYKPYLVEWSNSAGTGSNKYFQDIEITYAREFRYFEETENVPDGWTETTVSRIKNGFTYYKYYRELYEGQTYLEDERTYLIIDELDTSDYVIASFKGLNTELRTSDRFYNFNDLLEKLLQRSIDSGSDLESDIPDTYYLTNLKNFHTRSIVNSFVVKGMIESLRDKFNIYFQYDYDNRKFYLKELDFNTKLVDIDYYIDMDSVTLKKPAQMITYDTDGWQLDFRSQKLIFNGNKESKESKVISLITDIETEQKNEDNYLLVETYEITHNQSKERFTAEGSALNNGLDALYMHPDGSSVSWNSDNTEDPLYFDAYSNEIYIGADGQILLSYIIRLYEGSIRVRIGNHDQTYTHSGGGSPENFSYGGIITSSSDVDYLRLTIPYSGADNIGYITDIQVKTDTLLPVTANGITSGRNLKNGNLALSNTIYNKKPLSSFVKGELKDYGTIDCNANYNKEIQLTMPLGYELWDYDFDAYLNHNSEKYIIFEEKRKIIQDDNGTYLSEMSNIIAKSNEIY